METIMSVLSTLKHLFPPPRYITLPNVGIDISESSMKYIRFERKHAHDRELWLSEWGEVSIEKDVIKGGVVNNVDKLAEALKKVGEKTGVNYIRLSLPEERAYLFETTIKQDTPYKEIRGLLEFKLEENVPLSPRDAYFDYDIVENDKEHDAIHVVVAVYAKKTIVDYYEACTKAGLIPINFEIEAQAIARASIQKNFEGASMVIDFGKTRTGVGIVLNGSLMYTSTIEIGGLSLSSALRETIGDLAEDEFTTIKNTKGLVPTTEYKEGAEALCKVVESIKDEIATRIQYWHTRSDSGTTRDIKQIVLCGGSSNLRGLPEYFEREFSIPTRRADVWQNAFSLETFIPPIQKRYSYGYTTAAGLALYDFVENDL